MSQSVSRSDALFVFVSAYHALHVMDNFSQYHKLTERWAADVLGNTPDFVAELTMPPELGTRLHYFRDIKKLTRYLQLDSRNAAVVWTAIRQTLLASAHYSIAMLLRRLDDAVVELERLYDQTLSTEVPEAAAGSPHLESANTLTQMAACITDFALLSEWQANRASRPQFNGVFSNPRLFVKEPHESIIIELLGEHLAFNDSREVASLLERRPQLLTTFWQQIVVPVLNVHDELVHAARGRYRYECLLMESASHAASQLPIHIAIRRALNDLGIVNHAPDAEAIAEQCRRMPEEEPPEGAMYYIWVPIIEGTAREDVPDIAVMRWYSKSNDTIYEVQRRVVTAANVFHLLDGRDIVVPAARHFSPAMSMVANLLEESGMMDRKGRIGYRHEDQGFIDQFDRYLTREEAYIVADAYGRILKDRNGDDKELYSEGLH